ncbi:MAG: hypothetical protein EHM51_01285 [Geobacter sp.]|nr:MAG: hypothetical protein EHM51_01285 [Geobacter sp.]
MKSGTLAMTVALGAMLILPWGVQAKDKKHDLSKGYQLSKKMCTKCHDSVANPEAGSKTRDEWHIIIDVMHKKFSHKMTGQEVETLIDYFYSIRKGSEKEAG